MIDDLIKKLEKRLTEPLPGAEAHVKMKPTLPSGARFNPLDRSTAKKSAVLLLLYKKNDEWYFPLIQRPFYQGIHSGQVALPGGKMEELDVDLVATALRESQEEVGTDPTKVVVLGSLSEFFVAVSDNLVLPVVGFYTEPPVFIADPREVDHVIEAPLSHLMDVQLLKEKEITAASGYKLRSPYFEIDGKVVWGATAMMLSEFVEIFKELKHGTHHK